GHVWAEGEITYAANLIGARVLFVLTYYLPQLVLGASIDTIAVTSGLLFAALCLALAIWVFVAVSRYRVLLFMVLSALALGWIEWAYPQTEPVHVLLVTCVLLLLELSRRATSSVSACFWIIGAACVCGIGTGFRPEAAILAVALAVCFTIAH